MTVHTDYEKNVTAREIDALHDRSTAFDPIHTKEERNTHSVPAKLGLFTLLMSAIEVLKVPYYSYFTWV